MNLFISAFLCICCVSVAFGDNPYTRISSETTLSKASSDGLKNAAVDQLSIISKNDRVSRFLSTSQRKLSDYSWEQLGDDIIGESINDRSGTVAISSDGTVIAVGARLNDEAGDKAGDTRIFKYDDVNAQWIQLGCDIYGAAADDRSGTAVALSDDGTIVAIGAPFYEDSAMIFSTGHVRVYDYNGTTWNKRDEDIVPTWRRRRDLFGSSLAFSSGGNMLAIGAPSNKRTKPGYVSVFSFNGTSWAKVGADIVGTTNGDRFGASVAITKSEYFGDDRIVAIGAPGNYSNPSSIGYVKTLKLVGGVWSELGIPIDGEASNDLGRSVALSSDGYILAIGAPRSDVSNNGSVRVYEFQPSNSTWTQLGQQINGEANGSLAGNSLDISADGSTLAIGAPGNDYGYVSVFYLNGTSWDQHGDNINGRLRDKLPDNFSGGYVAISSDGTHIAIGAPCSNIRKGSVRVMQSVLATPYPNASRTPAPRPNIILFNSEGYDPSVFELTYLATFILVLISLYTSAYNPFVKDSLKIAAVFYSSDIKNGK